MINKDRIVPVTATDLLSLYGLILGQTVEGGVSALDAVEIGNFEVTEADGALICAEPVAKLNFGDGVSSATVYFVPAYDYAGFEVNGAAVETTGDEVDADHGNLYSATLASGAVTIAKVGF